MSLQPHSLNPLLYRKDGKQVKTGGIGQVREVDLVYEMWKVLQVKDVSPKYFVENALGFFQISSGIQLDGSCHRFGRNFIPDLLLNCSKCRMKLYAIEKFVEYESQLDQQSLLVMLLRPLKVVLKKFQEELAVEAQKQLTISQNLETINCYLIKYMQKVDKTHNFFKEVLQFVAMNSTEEIPMELVKTVWKRFLLGLNSAVVPDDEFPLWAELYIELINLLGKYFSVVCDRGQLIIEDLDFRSGGSNYKQSSSLYCGSSVQDKFQSVSSNQLGLQNHSKNEVQPSYFFHLLLTSKLEADFLQSFRFAEKIKFDKVMAKRGHSFQDIFETQEKLMNLKAEFRSLGNPFKLLVELLEKSARSYKEQFMNYIFVGIKANNRLSITLSEIKEFYSMRAFASTMAGLLDIFNQPTNMTDCLQQLEKDVIAVQGRFYYKVNDIDDESSYQNQWMIKMYDGEEPWLLRLTGKLEWPLSCILDEELLELLRRSFETCQRLFHSYNMVVNLMQKDKFGSVSASLLVRRKRMLGQNLFQSVSVIYSVLRTRFELIISEKSALLLQCKSLKEMEQIVKIWKQQFKKLLDFDDLNKGSFIHAAVDGLCHLIGKFNASEEGAVFDQSSDITVGSAISGDHCSANSLTGIAKKPERNIEKWIKALSRVITVLNVATDPSRAIDSNSVAYEIAARSPKNPVLRR